MRGKERAGEGEGRRKWKEGASSPLGRPAGLQYRPGADSLATLGIRLGLGSLLLGGHRRLLTIA